MSDTTQVRQSSMVRRFARLALAFCVAVVSTAAAASVVQTQVNLAAITALGPSIEAALRAQTTVEDLVWFGPVMAAIAAGALLPAFVAGHVVARLAPGRRSMVFAVAAVAGLWAAFHVMGFFTPMPTLVSAVRGSIGLALVCATGLIGGLVYARLAPVRATVRP